MPICRTNVRISGRLRMKLSTGTRERKATVAGINPRKSKRKPYVSIHMPTIGQPNSTMKMPMKKADDALSLCRWKKNQNVRSIPIIKARPEIKRRLPTASKPLSKSISTPRKRNEMPKPASPRPIFCVSDIDIIVAICSLLAIYVPLHQLIMGPSDCDDVRRKSCRFFSALILIFECQHIIDCWHIGKIVALGHSSDQSAAYATWAMKVSPKNLCYIVCEGVYKLRVQYTNTTKYNSYTPGLRKHAGLQKQAKLLTR